MKVFKSIFTDWKIARRVIITLLLILLFRWGVMITIPGTTINESEYIDSGSFIGIMNMLGGGGLTTFSIFALGVSPYITASIIIQLLSADVIPPLARLNKQGEKGRIKVERITRYLTIFLAIIQSYAVVIGLDAAGYLNLGAYSDTAGMMVLVSIMVSGSMISLWIADQITLYGVGNGTSIIIFVGIVARIPTLISGQFNWFINLNESGELILIGILQFVFYFGFTLGIVWWISFFESSERRLPIQQTGQGLNLVSDSQTYLPVKVNPAGVIPVIFASSIISLPGTIAQFFTGTAGSVWVIEHFSLTNPFGLTIYAILLFLFTFFYSHINIDSIETSKNFQKSSTFIIGVKPGEETERYISKTITTLAFIGGIELTMIAILPYILTFFGMPKEFAVGGTSMIILVSVAIDTWEQLQARVIASSTSSKQKVMVSKFKKSDPNKKEGEGHTILFD